MMMDQTSRGAKRNSKPCIYKYKYMQTRQNNNKNKNNIKNNKKYGEFVYYIFFRTFVKIYV